MKEAEVLYQYEQASLRAQAVGMYLAATREDFSLRDWATLQEWARCVTVAEVHKQISNRALFLRLTSALSRSRPPIPAS